MADRPSVQTRFGLRRSNFVLDPLSDEDADFFANRTGVNVGKIIEDLQIDLSTGLPPKRMIWGPYGGGKTHTLQHTMRKLSSLTPVQPVYVECPDLSKRSSFLELYRDGIMRSCGQDFIMGLLQATRDRVGYAPPDEIFRKLRDLLQDEELAKAVAILTQPTDQNKLLLWSWISGVPIPRTGLPDLGQTQDLTAAEPARLAHYITVIGKLVRDFQDSTLILVLDEMDRIGFVGADTIVQFRTAFTRLLDPNQKYISILLGLSAKNFPELPDIFDQGGPIVSRLGRDAIQPVPMLEDIDVEPFIQNIIGFLRDPDADLDGLITEAKNATNEDVPDNFFPFTQEAIEAIKVSVGQEMTPREITLKMTRSAGKAHNYDKPVITSDLID
jgi:hypothetical protein